MDWKDKYLKKVVNMDCLEAMKELLDNSIDCIVTDPPYGYSFMGKDWDSFNEVVNPQGAYADKKGFKKLPRNKAGEGFNEFFVPIWKECLRVLKDGAFAFVMSAPRQDTLSKQIVALQQAGFQTGFTSIYWTYASGFPKASNIGKMVDKKLGVKGDKIIEKKSDMFGEREIEIKGEGAGSRGNTFPLEHDKTQLGSKQAKSLDGSYGGFQPKPAIEIILVVMKSLSEKTYVDQAMKNGKGITRLDDGRIPFENEKVSTARERNIAIKGGNYKAGRFETDGVMAGGDDRGRFPANLLVSDDVLDDGNISKSMGNRKGEVSDSKARSNLNCSIEGIAHIDYDDSGSFSRYFSLDKWFESKLKDLSPAVQKVFPFLIVPKASKSEKNEGCDELEKEKVSGHKANFRCKKCGYQKNSGSPCKCDRPEWEEIPLKPNKNFHPTCKPIKLMSYLITIGSREKDIILDPFAGSCTTGVSCIMLNRQFVMIEKEKEYFEIGKARLEYAMSQFKLFYGEIMSHAREIKPSFFTDEELAELPFEARLWFAGLWCQADREGRLEEKIKELKANVMPHDNVNPEKMLELLSKNKKYSNKPFIYRYKVNNKRYIQILEFRKHQPTHNTEANSIIPLSTDIYNILYNIDIKGRKRVAGDLKLENGYVTVTQPLEMLKGLKLYEKYGQLLKKLPEMLLVWKEICPGVNIENEIKKAHSWELENPKRRKIDKIRFLGAWMRRCQDRGGGYRQTEQPKASPGKYDKFK